MKLINIAFLIRKKVENNRATTIQQVRVGVPEQECCLDVQIDKFLRWLQVAVAFFSIRTFMKMPNGEEKKCQTTDNC